MSYARIAPVGWMYLAAAAALLAGCEKDKPDMREFLFSEVPPSHSGIDFINQLNENDTFNIIEYLYYYNGAGVAAGDIDNDGLTDIFFTANQDSNRLYLNKGDFRFEDISGRAGVNGGSNWKTGVTMADVNADGWLDIFVCGVGSYKSFNGRNQLFINNHDGTFTDKAREYGLFFSGFSTQASFFDYDNDGDLDLYLLNHSVHTARSFGDISLRFQSDSLAGDRLYRNDPGPDGVPRFHDVTGRAGILHSQIGYGLGVGISDLNLDGYPDIYVSNDFHENDYMYLNNGDGTFSQELEKSIEHTSKFSMGSDIADINNDGWPDIMTLDMLPRDEEIIKTTAGEDPYEIFDFKLRFGFHAQFARNAMQLNRGLHDYGKTLIFSDIACFSGVEATDWSWAPLLADFDNDGARDLFVANGIVRRPNDLDYINFISQGTVQQYYTDRQLYERMPHGDAPNMFFRNKGTLQFEDVTGSWIGRKASLSNGAAYADLDNDGDLDLIVNNINGIASVYRNNLADPSSHFLRIELRGNKENTFGIGAKVLLFAAGRLSFAEQFPVRGWMSSVDYVLHFGLGATSRVDSVFVIWPDGKYERRIRVESNQTATFRQEEAQLMWNYDAIHRNRNAPVLTAAGDIPFRHRENTFVAFNVERLMPHMLSTQGPKLAVGDIDGDGLDDFFVGGAKGQAGAVFLQDKEGNFIRHRVPGLGLDLLTEDMGAAIVDVNNDHSPDLVITSGSGEEPDYSRLLQPRLYLNNGEGQLKRSAGRLPVILSNASCVKASDFDNDGDVDLFVGGRVVAGTYGKDPPSFLLMNDGHGVFSDQSSRLFQGSLAERQSLGMVSDACWGDVNSDGRQDLVVVGEWEPVRILLQNERGGFRDATSEFGLANTEGWWNTVAPGDFDGDGDVDLIAGNLGLNSRLRASTEQPVEIYIGDIDDNGTADPIITYYNQGQKYPFLSKDQLLRQVPALKKKFLRYADYKDVVLQNIVPVDEMRRVIHKQSSLMASVYLENDRNARFIVHALPTEAQLFPIFAICPADVNHDGNLDFLCGGNLYAVQPEYGRYDAGYGLVVLGDGQGHFRALSHQESGFLVRGEIRDIKVVNSATGQPHYLVARNNDTVLVFK